MRVGRYNYPSQFGGEASRLFAELEAMILSGSYVLTREVAAFEAAFAGYVGVKHVRGVNSGTDALIIALLALGVGRGDEVITQANTFNATVAAIRLIGAIPVLVDANDESFLIDEAQVAAAITPRTRVILPVHLYGKPTPMAGLQAQAERHGLELLEDAAQAHGARIGGRRVGSFGVASCFSFHPSKNLAAAGDGGAIATSSDAIAERVRRLRELGQQGQNNHVVAGYNSKLDAIQARIVGWKLEWLDQWNEARRVAAARYREGLSGLPLTFQQESAGEEHVYHLFQVRTPERDALLAHLRANGIDAVIRYETPIHLQPAFSDCGFQPGQFPVAERLAKELLCLPIRPDLSPEEVGYVCDTTRELFSGRRQRAAVASARPG
jgi:dTDP-4-amino-4,6-dideoxygalactose transaminase